MSLLDLSLESMRADVQRALRTEPQSLDVGFFDQLVEEAHKHERLQADASRTGA